LDVALLRELEERNNVFPELDLGPWLPGTR
jgi:hypothetical protein